MTTPPLALGEPIVVAEFWANRSGCAIRVQLVLIEGLRCVDVRRYQNIAGKLQPTHKGIALAIHKLPVLAAAIAKARELGFIKDGAAP
jgi:hypothetical protein